VACVSATLQLYLSKRPHSQYNTRSRPHNKTLVAKTVDLNESDFFPY